MAGGHRIETKRQRLGGQGGELDPLIAAHARVRSLAARIGIDEVLDHVVLESVSEIPDIEGNSENVGDAARIGGVLLGAASARSGSQRAGGLRQRQVDTDHLVAGIDHAGGSHRGVDSAAHRGQHLHRDTPTEELASAA